ncbi:MAG: hypothetical protein IK079_04600 [Desulfovibrio sp.]|nr:hypothetical protein [Desulfovibrio sp.]
MNSNQTSFAYSKHWLLSALIIVHGKGESINGHGTFGFPLAVVYGIIGVHESSGFDA